MTLEEAVTTAIAMIKQIKADPAASPAKRMPASLT
jgi:hypothetical protein